MIMISILAMTGLITIATGSPMSYATYRRRDLPVDERPELLVLYGQTGLENSDSSPRSVYDIEREYGNEISLQDISDVPKSVLSRIARDKKNGLGRNSLSIVNPIDVLRQRVLLQLARKKAMQQQRQIDANRRMLDSVGKRSVHELDSGYPRTILPSQSVENRVYTTDRQNEARNDEHEPQQAYTQRNPMERTREWYNVDETVIRGNGDDDTRKVLSNYHHDRM